MNSEPNHTHATARAKHEDLVMDESNVDGVTGTTAKRTRTRTRRRRLARLIARGHAGMTLIEIMVVVIIMGLIMSTVGIGVFSQLRRAKIRDAQQEVEVIRSAVRLYQNDHPGQCPTTEQLRADGVLDQNRATTDPWGHSFSITCEGEDVAVVSAGPDGRPGSDDDISGQSHGPAPEPGAGGGNGH